MNTNTINGLMFIVAGLTPPIVYLGLGPDGTGVLNMARTEQIFAYLFFSLPIAFMMTRRIQTNYCQNGSTLLAPNLHVYANPNRFVISLQ